MGSQRFLKLGGRVIQTFLYKFIIHHKGGMGLFFQTGELQLILAALTVVGRTRAASSGSRKRFIIQNQSNLQLVLR